MSPELRHYLITEHAIGAAVVNFLLNALIAWLAFGNLETVPMWGQQSIVGDTVGTVFVLTLLTSLIATRIVRWHLSAGKGPAEGPSPDSYGYLRMLPAGLKLRSLVLALAVTAVVGLPAAGLLSASGLEGMPLGSFVVFKATFAALLSVLVQPMVALRALMEEAAPQPATA